MRISLRSPFWCLRRFAIVFGKQFHHVDTVRGMPLTRFPSSAASNSQAMRETRKLRSGQQVPRTIPLQALVSRDRRRTSFQSDQKGWPSLFMGSPTPFRKKIRMLPSFVLVYRIPLRRPSPHLVALSRKNRGHSNYFLRVPDTEHS